MEVNIEYKLIVKCEYCFEAEGHYVWIGSGSGLITISGMSSVISEEQLLYVPARVPYQIESESRLLAIIIKEEEVYPDDLIYLSLDDRIKAELAMLILATDQINKDINEYFKSLRANRKKSKGETINFTIDQRIIEVLQIIHNSYPTRITVDQISKTLYISPGYLTSVFKRELGMPISKYLQNVRLGAAVELLLNSTIGVMMIADSVGFADARMFNKSFRSRFGITPREMRVGYRNISLETEIISNNQKLYSKYFKLFTDVQHDVCKLSLNKTSDIGHIKNDINCFAISRAYDLLTSEVQAQIIRAKGEINFKYCLFHNIFGDEMNIINKHGDGTYEVTLVNILKVCDFLYANDIIPFIELGYFPKEIACDQTGPFTGYNLNTGGKVNYQLWDQLIKEFISVANKRYPNITEWRFSFFNAVDFNSYWPNSLADLNRLYKSTYQIVKMINPNLSIGGFGFANLTKDDKLIRNILDRIYDSGISLDFLTMHSYPFEVSNCNELRKTKRIVDVQVKYNPHKLHDDITKINALCEYYGINQCFITEWNSILSQTDSLNDETYKAASIIRAFINLNQRGDACDGITYWVLSDTINEQGLRNQEFHGGIGLITYNGICKPAYMAMKIINRIQGEIISINENGMVTKSGDRIWILAHNCIAVNSGGTAAEEMQRNIQATINELKIEVDLNGLSGQYTVDQYLISEQNSPIFWARKQGINEYLLKADIEYLQFKGQLFHERKRQFLAQSSKVSLKLKENEVCLIEYKKIKEIEYNNKG